MRLDETATESDVGALHKWLERERPLDEMVRTSKLQIHERRRTDDTDGGTAGTPMGVDMEIVVTVLETTVLVVEVLDLVRRAVDAWRGNRARVEDGDPPTVTVDPEDPQAGDPGRSDTEDGDPPAARVDG
ncbi:hypothetical protein AB0K80_29625 [Streptomyces sp. NPDC052682]|uniref:hypothetical protein n=1 Tax=Streptomyces sp. NPDC052682 TaxID=3154954 RepID=UPI003435FE6C